MEYLLTNIFSYSIVTTLITLIITKITEGRIQSSFDKKLEQTKLEYSLEIAKFQNEIDSLKAKENFKFTKLHEQRFEVLKTTYTLLNKTRNDLSHYVIAIKVVPNNTTYDENEFRLNQNFRESHEEFIRYFDDNLIFFSENLESIITGFLSECFQIFIDYDTNNQMKISGQVDKEVRKKAVFAYKRLNENIQPIMVNIRTEFREMLGANL